MKVLFCGKHFEAGYIYTKEILQDLDESISVIQCEDNEVPLEVVDADLIICFMHKITKELIDLSSNLKVITQFGVGLEGVDIPYATEKGILVANIPGELCGNAQSCSEHAIFLALSLLRNINRIKDAIQTKRLGFPLGKTLFKSNILIYGFGSIGRELFRRLQQFLPSMITVVLRKPEPEILAELSDLSDPAVHVTVMSHSQFQEVTEHSLSSEQIFICCTQNKDNFGFVNKSFLEKFQNSVNLINIARVRFSTKT